LQKYTLRKAIYAVCLIQFSLMFIFTAINMFLVSRHTLGLILTVLLFAPFSLNYFYEKWQQTKVKKQRIGGWVLIALIILVGIDGLDVGTKRHGIIEQGQWLKSQVADEYSVYSNSNLLLHYADRKPAYLKLSYKWVEANHLLVTKQIYDFDYAAIEIDASNKAQEEYIEDQIEFKPLAAKTFANGKRVLLYDLRNASSNTELGEGYFKIKEKRLF